MRLFAGLDLPDDTLNRLEDLLHKLRPVAKVNWSPVANLHVTTKFVGEWPEDRLDELKAALAQVPKPGAIRIAIKGLGWFPNPHHPRVFFAGVEAPAALHELAANTDQAAAKVGVPSEDKKYSPHLTLARVKTPESLPALRQAVAKLDSADFGEFEARSFFLYLSKPGPGGSVYSKLAEFPLA